MKKIKPLTKKHPFRRWLRKLFGRTPRPFPAIDEMHEHPDPVIAEALRSASARVTPREEVRARWIRKLYYPDKDLYTFTCGSCLYGCFHSYQSTPIWGYCPNCGTKMEAADE